MRGAYETPTEQCPYCGRPCEADWCDVGVGMQQVGPYHCDDCGASEAGAYEDTESRHDYDPDTGWYRPGSPPGSTANVDNEGRHITWRQADSLYRISKGVPPRY